MAFHWLENKCKIFVRPCATLYVLTFSKDWRITWNVPASPILHISHPACLYPGYTVSSSHMTLSHGVYVIIPIRPSRLDSLIIYLQEGPPGLSLFIRSLLWSFTTLHRCWDCLPSAFNPFQIIYSVVARLYLSVFSGILVWYLERGWWEMIIPSV